MKLNRKVILLIVVLIIIIPLAYIGISGYLQQLEEQTFYDTIKNVSDIENKSDIENMKIINQSSASREEMTTYINNSINAINQEVELLSDLKNKVSNESYKEYIDIEISRLNSENRTNNIMQDYIDVYNQYKNGEIGSSHALSLINDYNQEITSYSNATNQYKVESDTFLSKHPDIRNKFNELGIDEDFMYNEIQEVNVNHIY